MCDKIRRWGKVVEKYENNKFAEYAREIRAIFTILLMQFQVWSYQEIQLQTTSKRGGS